jgi:hypothetical protein
MHVSIYYLGFDFIVGFLLWWTEGPDLNIRVDIMKFYIANCEPFNCPRC